MSTLPRGGWNPARALLAKPQALEQSWVGLKERFPVRERLSLIRVKVRVWLRGPEYNPRISELALALLHDWEPIKKDIGDMNRQALQMEDGAKLFSELVWPRASVKSENSILRKQTTTLRPVPSNSHFNMKTARWTFSRLAVPRTDWSSFSCIHIHFCVRRAHQTLLLQR